MSARQTSSIYSDIFELDDLLYRISKQADEQHGEAISSLEKEKGILKIEIAALQNFCGTVHDTLQRIGEQVTRLKQGLDKTVSSMKTDRIRYLANCTAF
ncbi:hypothetical protein CLIM01_09426 [Colletotrichum limetticola]|uniref:Uncharacterized protein n=1 Tax=Colletotrichum limetticola TaxID=1209924 RepID=A0ABQ9PNU9_9PEZI|nr:hypothetical protein CLIM01_09426 [Colletotrichum limetticola]